MSDRRVVVTGMGVITSLGETVDDFWSNLIAGKSGVCPITLFDAAQYDSRIGGECAKFDPDAHFDRKASKRLDRFAQFAVAAARQAMSQAGLTDNDFGDRKRMGCIIGSGIGGMLEFEQQYLRLLEKGPSKVSAFTIPKLMINAGAGNIAIDCNLRGISSTVGTACASACHAMRDAYEAVRTNRADVLVTGGSEAALSPLGLSAFCAMKALSTRNDDPTHASRPFDRDRDGFILGEGSGILVFEEYEHARKRGAKIYAEVLGFGATTDAGHIAQPAEDGSGAAESMRQCVEEAGLNLEDVTYINAHGTSTGLGDLAETVAIKRCFGPHAKKLAVSSTKSSIGHLLGASGGVEAVATVMAICNSTAPATMNLDNPSEGCDLDYIPNTPRDLRIKYAISNSFGFGGHNASILLGKVE
ncbi:MAG: beta-ketoacyl-ACP synthase II [Phycisphaerales bacterium]|nr:beta-ketoacyl-ACP synthase II [Phycisphaerales bacterium]